MPKPVAFQLRFREEMAAMIRSEARRNCMRPTAWLFQATVMALENAGHKPSDAMPESAGE